MKEKRKAEIALLVVRHLLKGAGISHDGLRGKMLEEHEAIGVSKEEIDVFVDTLVRERIEDVVKQVHMKKLKPLKSLPQAKRKAVRMTLMSPRS